MTDKIQPPSFKWNVLTVPRFMVMEHDGAFLRTEDGPCILVADLERLGFIIKHTGEEDYPDTTVYPWPALTDK